MGNSPTNGKSNGVHRLTEHLATLDATPRHQLPLIHAADYEQRPKPACLIEGMLIEATTSLLVAPPGTGKGLVAIDIAERVARGLHYAGNATKQGPVIYVALERAASLGARLKAWREHHTRGNDRPLYIVPATVSLYEPSGLAQLLHAIQRLDEPPRLIVLDTIAKAMLPGDENSTREMGQLTLHLQRLNDTGAHVLGLHHLNAAGLRERGNTALLGHADTNMRLDCKQRGTVTLSCHKQNELPHFHQLELTITGSAGSATITEATTAPRSPSSRDQDTRTQVRAHLDANPGARSLRKTRQAITGTNAAIDTAWREWTTEHACRTQ